MFPRKTHFPHFPIFLSPTRRLNDSQSTHLFIYFIHNHEIPNLVQDQTTILLLFFTCTFHGGFVEAANLAFCLGNALAFGIGLKESNPRVEDFSTVLFFCASELCTLSAFSCSSSESVSRVFSYSLFSWPLSSLMTIAGTLKHRKREQ